MAVTRPSVELDGVVIEKRHDADRGVVVTITNERSDAAIARFEDDLPAEGGLKTPELTAADGYLVLEAGTVEGTAIVRPGETVTVTYRLAGDAETLPAPRLLDVVPLRIETLSEPALTWRAPDGDRVPLATDEGAELTSARSRTTPADTGLAAPTRTDLPAIGVIVEAGDADAVYRTVLRAVDRGHRALVVTANPNDDEATRLAERLGATAVDPGGATTRPELERALSRAARAAGHPGIVIQPPSAPPIDYDRTLAAFAVGGFEMHAVPSGASGEGAVVVAIPAYNAGETIGDVVREARGFADTVLVVDDGSRDDTAEQARLAGASVVVHRRNRGYGGALKTAFQEAHRRGATVVVTLDADGQHAPGDVPKLVAALDTTDAGMVVGSRYVAGSETRLPLSRAIGLGVVNTLTNLSMGKLDPRGWTRDTQSGFRAYTADAVASLAGAPDIGDGMWASTDIMYHLSREGYAFGEVGTTIRYDVANSSSEGAVGHGLGLVRNIVGFVQHTHPMVLLGIPGVAAVLASTGLGIWALQLAATGQPSLGVSVATVLAMVLGFVLLVLAAILHVLNTHPLFRNDRWAS
jgi:hypothetical protein